MPCGRRATIDIHAEALHQLEGAVGFAEPDVDASPRRDLVCSLERAYEARGLLARGFTHDGERVRVDPLVLHRDRGDLRGSAT